MHRQISFERSEMSAVGQRRPAQGTDDAKRHPLLGLGRYLLAMAQRFLTAQRTFLRIRRDEDLLRQMSDHQLRDIGLARLPGGHFAPLGRDLWREQPVQNLNTETGAPRHRP
ncbi:hypothetical protein [Aureimonas glaciei]|uniref:DUF1127 domain-containing protein n=1 Tax=Aureimonas glaciei TaxID=1776957 RepID=A0A916Y7G7_9HYPH|nr:hypothetical protein [Aureimonas glaciei]GGD34243.1 hypothetical protein GCM10011335_41610 [Aureimonas glaciei]